MDREKYAREINALQDKVAAKHEKRIRAAIEDAWQSVARDLPTRARPDVPLDHIQKVKVALEGLYRDITRQTAARMVGQFKRGFAWIETKSDEAGFYERLYQEYLETYGGRQIAQISEATRRQIVRAIERGLIEGQTLDEIAADIMQRAPEIAEIRSYIIARTETHSASMFASLRSARRSTVPLVKEWVSVEDGRVRDFGEGDGIVDEFSHRAMNGVQVPLDDPFEVPMRNGQKEPLMYPGDPAGSPANVINCRCAQVYEEADDDEVEDYDNAPTIDPVQPEFRYQTIGKPNARVADIEAFILDNAIADMPKLSGVPVKAMADNVVRFLEVHERFDLDPLIGVGPISAFSSRTRSPKNVIAAIYPWTHKATGRKGIFHTPRTFGKPSEAENLMRVHNLNSTRAKYAESQKRQLDTLATDEVRNRAQLMEQNGHRYGWTIDNDAKTPDELLASTIYHEYGHVVHINNTKNPQMMDDLNAALRSARPRQNGWGALVSEYGTWGNKNDETHRDKEYIAETFALYMEGEHQHYRIHPEILAVFQRWDRTSTVKGFVLQEVKRMSIKEMDLQTNGAALIAAVLNAPENERETLARELLKNYTDPDKPLIEAWLGEAMITAMEPIEVDIE